MNNDPRNPQFSAEAKKEFDDICSRYPNKMAPLLMVLHLAEREFGWLSEEVQKYVAELLSLPPAHVSGVVTFYKMYKTEPKGKYRIQYCATLSCAIRGGEKIFDHMCARLGIKNHGTTPDGLVSLEKVECLGACERAPMMLVNDDTEANLDCQKVDRLMRSWGAQLKDISEEPTHA